MVLGPRNSLPFLVVNFLIGIGVPSRQGEVFPQGGPITLHPFLLGPGFGAFGVPTLGPHGDSTPGGLGKPPRFSFWKNPLFFFPETLGVSPVCVSFFCGPRWGPFFRGEFLEPPLPAGGADLPLIFAAVSFLSSGGGVFTLFSRPWRALFLPKSFCAPPGGFFYYEGERPPWGVVVYPRGIHWSLETGGGDT